MIKHRVFNPIKTAILPLLTLLILQAYSLLVTANTQDHTALIDEFCTDCHNNGEFSGDLSLEDMQLTNPSLDARIWEKVIHKLNIGLMPPPQREQPEGSDKQALINYLVTKLDHSAAENPNPGTYPLHRLNRSEYANAIRDLLGLEINIESLLPADSSTHGFDNISAVLKTSPLLLERYLAVAQTITATAIGDINMSPQTSHYSPSPYLSQNKWIEGLPLGTRGGILINHYFPVDGEYQFRPELWEAAASTVRGLEGFNEPFEYQMLIDGVPVHTAHIGGIDDDALSNRDQGSATTESQARLRISLPVSAGLHQVGFTFKMKSFAIEQKILQPFNSDLPLGNDAYGWPRIAQVFLTGPLEPSSPGDTSVRRHIFFCQPGAVLTHENCAKQIINRFAQRAWSRAITADETTMLVNFYLQGSKGKETRDSFEHGIQLAFTRMLSGPEFLFRGETAPPKTPSPAIYAIDDVSLASRLALFIWSSIPDDELLNIALANQLTNPYVLSAQVQRMLSDPRAHALINNFAEQWLQLRNVTNKTPDLQEFPHWDDNLRQDMHRETKLFLTSVLLEDQSVLTLIDADYSFLNQRLAEHYGVKGIFGDVFRRVEFSDNQRGGLLGQGSVLFETSVANRTSPVFRGKWIMSNIFNSPPSPPPPDIPSLDDGAPGLTTHSVRARLERHREDPACMSCHLVMDPPGFALENYDALGRWRDSDGGLPIDAAASLADGTDINGHVELKQAIMARPEVFVNTLTEKLMTYALARGLESTDMPVIRNIVKHSAETDYRFKEIVLAIVQSAPFRMKNSEAIIENIVTAVP